MRIVYMYWRYMKCEMFFPAVSMDIISIVQPTSEIHTRISVDISTNIHIHGNPGYLDLPL